MIVDARQIAVTGPDAGSAAAFLSELQRALSDEVTLIEKARDGFEVAYEVTPLTWKDGAYAPGETARLARAPKAGIWIEPLLRPETAQDGEVLRPRMFRRPAGQLVCRVHAVKHAAFFITVLRNAPELMDATKLGAAGMSHDRPGFHQRYIIDMAVHDRVLTKIGLNLVAKLLGLDLIRKAAFDAAVEYAREGKGAACRLRPEVFGDFRGDARSSNSRLPQPGASAGTAP